MDETARAAEDAVLADVYGQLGDQDSRPEYDVEAGLRRLQSWMQEPTTEAPPPPLESSQLRAAGLLRVMGGTTTLMPSVRTTTTARAKLADDLKAKYEAGESIRALAQETGRSYGFVHRMLSESGVVMRGKRGRSSHTREEDGG